VRAFLLAAGEGSRLRPLTNELPKCLVPIQGTPLLAIWLRLLERHDVGEVLVNLHHLATHVEEFLRSCRTSLRVVAVYEERLLGSAGTVLANRDFVAGDPDFLILYADNLTNVDLRRMVDFHRRRGGVLTVGVKPTDRPREKGIVTLERDGRVVEFTEKPHTPRSHMANAGIYVATPGVFEALPPSLGDGALDFGYHVLPRLTGRMFAYPIDEFLADIGTPEAYQEAQESWPGL
jgi:mannose-1-phosphate guanylyltransferase